MGRKRKKIKTEDALKIAYDFLEKKYGVNEIWTSLTNAGANYSRQNIYDALRFCRDSGYIVFKIPENIKIEQALKKRYKGDIHVTKVFGDENDSVAIAAANLIFEKIKLKNKEKITPVNIAFAGGIMNMKIAKELGKLIYSDGNDIETLRIISLNGGWSNRCELSPVYWLNSLSIEGCNTKFNFVGLFAPPFVPDMKTFNIIKNLPGVRGAFKLVNDIDIVVSSIGCALDSWIPYVSNSKKDELINNFGWAGDLMYLPYTANSGPLNYKYLDLIPFTLVNFDDLMKLKNDGREIILVCAPHLVSRKSKASALIPLLSHPKLRVWSHIVIDEKTGNELLG